MYTASQVFVREVLLCLHNTSFYFQPLLVKSKKSSISSIFFLCFRLLLNVECSLQRSFHCPHYKNKSILKVQTRSVKERRKKREHWASLFHWVSSRLLEIKMKCSLFKKRCFQAGDLSLQQETITGTPRSCVSISRARLTYSKSSILLILMES